MTTFKIRCEKCNYFYNPKSNTMPKCCPNCGKVGYLVKEEEHLARIIEIE